MGGVPSIPTDPSRKVEVIAAGYCRTGTVSTSLALEKLLDGPVFHGGTQFFGREDSYTKLWTTIILNRHNKPLVLKLLRQATAGFVAVADAPAIFFLPELLQIYPNARVVLVTRDPESWERSFARLGSASGLDNLWLLRLSMMFMPTWRWAYTGFVEIVKYNYELFGLPISIELYKKWNIWVADQVPTDRLLTMELGEGWQPLADFLDKPIPDCPFPRENQAQSMEAFAQHAYRMAWMAWAGILGTAVAVSWKAWSVCK